MEKEILLNTLNKYQFNFKMKKIILLLLFAFGCSSKQEYKTYFFNEGLFSIQLPASWSEYDDETDSFSFFDTLLWTGNLRISPFIDVVPIDSTKSKEFLMDRLKDEPTSLMSKIGKFDCAISKKHFVQDNKNGIIYFWALAKERNLFMCSFTIAKEREGSKENDLEIKKVEAILESIKYKNLPSAQ